MPARSPRRPGANVVAHAGFGFAATDLGPGFTWSENSHDNRLSPWRNDPVSDPPGEAIFLRDDENGRVWSATPLPAGGGRPYTVRHGQGYSIFEHIARRHRSALRLFVPRDERVKLFELDAAQRLGAHAAALGDALRRMDARRASLPHAPAHRHQPRAGDRRASSPRTRSASRSAIASPSSICTTDRRGARMVPPARTITGDRTEFIGRNGSLQSPAALDAQRLSDRVGAGLDPCGAVQLAVTLEPGEERTLIGQLGEAAGCRGGARRACSDSAKPRRGTRAADGAIAFWNGCSATIQVKTPEPIDGSDAESLAALSGAVVPASGDARRSTSRAARSGSATSCRTRWRCSHAAPHLVRAQLLRAASRQFVEGDVQHWWHEPGGQGVRTRFSDDRLWLIYCALLYVAATGDDAVWDEQVPFLEGRLLNEGEHEAYERPAVSSETGSLYEHCVRAIAHEPLDRRARPAADGHRRLERRHEPGRRGRTRRERLARLVPGVAAAARSPTSPTRAAKRIAPRVYRAHAETADRRRSTTPGTANGIAAPISTTGRRSDRRRTPSAGSTRSRSRGR